MRKYNRYTWGIIAAATVATAAIVMPAGAVTMDWDDLISNIGYLVEGHKGNTITLEIKMDKEDE